MIFSWTNTYSANPRVYAPKNARALESIIKKKKNFINFGMGRSYGDNCINKKNVISMKNFNKVISFDKIKGEINVQSGVILKDLLDLTIPHNWFFPTSPGTKFVTIGGLVANNVHGKNFRKNFFYDYINSLVVIDSLGKRIECSRNKNKFFFDLTIGGMGLTGVIISVNFSLKKISGTEIKVKKVFNSNLLFLQTFQKKFKNKNWEYAVIWLDSFKYNEVIRSITFLGKHKKKNSNKNIYKNKKVSFFHIMLFSLINNFWLFKLLNFSYLIMHKIFDAGTDHVLNYFYQFDKFTDWYKLYGRKGFKEFQFAISRYKIIHFFNEYYAFCKINKIYSNLIVLKPINQKKHYISMYGSGFSISMDFKYSKNIRLIDKFFLDAGKKYNLNFNLSKDLTLTSDYYSKKKIFKDFKKKITLVNKNFKFKSEQSNRLGITSE